ncbi:hypothetical protein Tco_1063534 [Tanacetum coccineum]
MPNKVRSGMQIGVKKKVVKKKVVKKKTISDSGEGTSQSPKWTKKQILESKKVICPFRIWIALEYFKEIIKYSFMPLRNIRDDIRQKFMIDVSLGQCWRVKQLALFDHEGGLIEHYGKLYQYRQALLDLNPGSTCRLDVDESANGSATFKRIYICFKGVKDGWLAGCRKGLIDAMNDWLSEVDESTYDYLIQRNPNSWSRAFFEMDRRCSAFENGISESFNRAILGPRHKPIITMLEEIRLYIMQRIFAMNKLAFSLEDRITPSIRKRLEILKKKQRMWELSGVPCVHVVAAYLHVGIDLDLGVSHWYSQDCWFNAYQFSIKPIFGSNMWKRTNDVQLLPSLIRTMPGIPQKARIKAHCETSGSHLSRMGRTMTCTNYWQKGHNKATCKADPAPKPTLEKKQPGRKKHVVIGHYASTGRGKGRGGLSCPYIPYKCSLYHALSNSGSYQ